MALRQPTTAILTVTVLAAVSASPARAVDCNQLAQTLVGQFGVVLKYQDGVTVVSQRCDQIRDARVVDTTALVQCDAALQNLRASYQQANATYSSQFANFSAQCKTTMAYGNPLQSGSAPNSAPLYATDPNGAYYADSPTTPYKGQPYLAQPIAPTPATPTDANSGTTDANSGPFVNPTVQDLQIIGGFFGAGSRGGRGGGGFKQHC